MKRAKISGGFVVLLAAVFCFLPSAGWGASVTCVNPGDLTTYINGLTNADANTTIMVTGPCTGEKVQVTVSSITLQGSSTPTDISGNGKSPVIKVNTRNVTIQGFNITGGTIGVQVADLASANIVGNTISANTTAGIVVRDNSQANIGFLKDSDATPTPNTIESNGIGVQVCRSSSARIVGNTIESNTGNGIVVDKVSHADIDGNTINKNSPDGIYVSGNSGVDLGGGDPDTIFDSPNYTTNGHNNATYAIACNNGAYVAGYLGSLTGASAKAPNSFSGTCVNALASSSTVVGDWTVASSSGFNNPPSAINFYSDATGTAQLPDSTTQTFTWTLAGSKLTLTFSPADIASGSLKWQDLNDVTYNFTETGKTQKKTLALTRVNPSNDF